MASKIYLKQVAEHGGQASGDGGGVVVLLLVGAAAAAATCSDRRGRNQWLVQHQRKRIRRDISTTFDRIYTLLGQLFLCISSKPNQIRRFDGIFILFQPNEQVCLQIFFNGYSSSGHVPKYVHKQKISVVIFHILATLF